MNFTSTSFILAAAFLLLACSDSGQDGEPWDLQGDRSVSVCVDMAQTRCERLADCGLLDQPSNDNSGRRYDGSDACLTREEMGCQIYGEEFGQARISTCVAEVGDSSCDQLAEDHLYFGTPRCVRQLRRPDGEACSTNLDCASSRCSDGACAPERMALIGQACDIDDACTWWGECVDGECQAAEMLACAQGDCEYEPIESAEDDRCGSSINEEDARHRCIPGMECMARNDMGAGYCAPYAADGEACGRPYETDAQPCLWPAQCEDDADGVSTCVLPEKL